MEKKVIKKGDIFEINTYAFQSDKAFYCRIGPKFPAFDIETLIHLLPSEIIPSDDYNKAFDMCREMLRRKDISKEIIDEYIENILEYLPTDTISARDLYTDKLIKVQYLGNGKVKELFTGRVFTCVTSYHLDRPQFEDGSFTLDYYNIAYDGGEDVASHMEAKYNILKFSRQNPMYLLITEGTMFKYLRKERKEKCEFLNEEQTKRLLYLFDQASQACLENMEDVLSREPNENEDDIENYPAYNEEGDFYYSDLTLYEQYQELKDIAYLEDEIYDRKKIYGL